MFSGHLSRFKRSFPASQEPLVSKHEDAAEDVHSRSHCGDVNRTGAASRQRLKIGAGVPVGVSPRDGSFSGLFGERLQQAPLEVLLGYFRYQELQQKIKDAVDHMS